MKLELTRSLGAGLQEHPEDSLAYLYHENSKLTPAGARQLSASFSMSRSELFITSRPFRQQRSAEAVPLDLNEKDTSCATLVDTLFTRRSMRALSCEVPFTRFSRLLDMSVGATALAPTEEEDISQIRRAWPSAGGIYPLDTYIIARNISNLPPSIYSYNIPNNQIEMLEGRDVGEVLDEGFFRQSWISSAAAVIVFVGVMERTLSKYEERGYRLIMLDAGHAGQNVLLSACALGLGACAIGGFNDNALAHDLLIDGSHEAVVHAIAIGGLDDGKAHV